MKKVLILALVLLMSSVVVAGEPDEPGCKDHPLLSRMPGYRIQRCESRQFESLEFWLAGGKNTRIEGHYTKILYALNDGAAEPSRVQIQRNYENAIKSIGGQVLYNNDEGNVYLKVFKDGRELYVVVGAYITSQYTLDIVDKEAMAQDVTANAAAFSAGLKAAGHVAIYGIYIDSGKSELKPESATALAELAKLLKSDPSLKLFVVGHTDGTAGIELNMKLSQARAEAVVQALVSQHGIAASRLKGYGVGPLCPIESNDSEAGKAKNRRVELVKQ
jgi:OOP family OmpA-OmpF porin